MTAHTHLCLGAASRNPAWDTLGTGLSNLTPAPAEVRGEARTRAAQLHAALCLGGHHPFDPPSPPSSTHPPTCQPVVHDLPQGTGKGGEGGGWAQSWLPGSQDRDFLMWWSPGSGIRPQLGFAPLSPQRLLVWVTLLDASIWQTAWQSLWTPQLGLSLPHLELISLR